MSAGSLRWMSALCVFGCAYCTSTWSSCRATFHVRRICKVRLRVCFRASCLNASQVVRERRPCHLYFDLEYVPGHNPAADGDTLLERLLQLLEAALRCAPFAVVFWWERTAGHVIRRLVWASALLGRLLQLLEAALRYGLVVSRSSKAQGGLHMERRRQRAHGAAAAAAGGRPQVQRFLTESAFSAIHEWLHHQEIGAVALPKLPPQNWRPRLRYLNTRLSDLQSPRPSKRHTLHHLG